MIPHAHRIDVVDRAGTRHQIVSTVSHGDEHDHEYTLRHAFVIDSMVIVPAGTTFKTNGGPGGFDHRHQAVLGSGGAKLSIETELAYEPAVVTDFEALRMSAYGEPVEKVSGLPSSIEQDIPTAFRYWMSDDHDQRRALRDAVIRLGVAKHVAYVDGEPRLIHREGSSVQLRRDAFPDEYVGAVLAAVTDVDVDENALLRSVYGFGNEEVVTASAVDLIAKMHRVSPADAVQQLLVSADCDVLVDVTDCHAHLPSGTRSLVWRPMWSRKWYLSTSVPDGYVEFLQAPQSQSVVSYVQQAPQSIDGDVGALVKWMHGVLVANESSMRTRVEVAISDVIDVEKSRNGGVSAAILSALGISDLDAIERVSKAVGDEASWELVEKSDERREAVYFVLRADCSDHHHDVMSPDEVRKTRESWMRGGHRFGLHHRGEALTDDDLLLLDVWVFDEPTTLYGKQVNTGDFLVRVKSMRDDLWDDIRSGRFGGVSPQGIARRTPLED